MTSQAIKWRFTIMAMYLLPLYLVGCSDPKAITQVKGGILDLCPNHTVKQMVDGFMGSPSWETGKTGGGQVFVNVAGDITFHDAPVRAKLQFVVDGSQFSFNAFEMNGVPSANIVAAAMMSKMCENATPSREAKIKTEGLTDAEITARMAEQLKPLSEVQNSVAEFYAENGKWPVSCKELAVCPRRVSVGEAGVIHLSLSGIASEQMVDKSFWVQPRLESNGDVTWKCSSDVAAKFLPHRCSTSAPQPSSNGQVDDRQT